MPEQLTMEFEGLGMVNMCHHPYSEGFLEKDKYDAWRPNDDSKLLLNGHVHEKWLTKLSPNRTPMINVGVDQHNFTPVSLEQLIKIRDEEFK